MIILNAVEQEILANVLADFRDKKLGSEALEHGYEGASLPNMMKRFCADGAVSQVDFELAVKQLEPEILVKTGPMMPYENDPNSGVFVLAMFSRREYVYLTEAGYRAAQQRRLTPNPAGPAVARDRPTGFDDLLHPLVRAAAIRHYEAGDFRNAVLDAITAVFDKIRERTGIDLDGDRLVTQAMSLQEPILILSELETDSGRNDQSGFMDIFRGFYRGVRNPKAHSLVHDLDAVKAGQHLVLASILMRRVVDAQLVETVKTKEKRLSPDASRGKGRRKGTAAT